MFQDVAHHLQLTLPRPAQEGVLGPNLSRVMSLTQLQQFVKCKTNTVPPHKLGDEEAAERPAKTATNEKDLLCKLNWHLIPIFLAMTVMCYLDRTNLAFAAVQLNRSLGFTEYAPALASYLPPER